MNGIVGCHNFITITTAWAIPGKLPTASIPHEHPEKCSLSFYSYCTLLLAVVRLHGVSTMSEIGESVSD